MKLNRLAAFRAAFIFIFSACTKGDDDAVIVHGTWKNTSFIRNYLAPVINQVDMLNSLAPCMRDNLMVLRPDNSYEHNEGASKCDPGYPQVIESGTYQVLNSNTRMNFSSGYTPEILELTATTLKLKFTYTGPGSQYFDMIVYTRQ